MGLDREGGRQTLRLGQSPSPHLHYKSTEMGVEKRPARTSELHLNCITNRRRWGSNREPRDRVDSDREGSRHALGLHRSAGMRLHYKSTKMAAEKKSAWPFGFGSGRGSPDSTLGAVSEPYLPCITNRRKWGSKRGPRDHLSCSYIALQIGADEG